MLKRMEEIQKFKEFFGPAAKGYSDPQLRQLRREMYAMAELLLDIHLYKRTCKRPAHNVPNDFDGHRSKS